MNFLNDSIAFYEIDNDYIEYLHQVDSNVYYHPSYRATIKPYVGILVDIENTKYFIPLTSAKEKHKKQRMRSRDYLMIYDLVDKNSNEENAIYCDVLNIGVDREDIIHIMSESLNKPVKTLPQILLKPSQGDIYYIVGGYTDLEALLA